MNSMGKYWNCIKILIGSRLLNSGHITSNDRKQTIFPQQTFYLQQGDVSTRLGTGLQETKPMLDSDTSWDGMWSILKVHHNIFPIYC